MTNSPAVQRMRRHRERRRDGLRCLTIEICDIEIDLLIRKGLLSREMRNDLVAVRHALHHFLDQTLN
jgi:hypothetical protein